ncbi:MAG: AMP-binding protein [Acidobacteria bacterium]|nr:AMP-binding protein [Acidobacteriota bacterium]
MEWAGAARTDTTTYGALVGASARIAGWLQHAGIAPGDRVAIFADNDARWIEIYLGVLRRAAVVVPLDTAYSAEQVRTILADCGARVLFTSARRLDTARAAVASMGAGAPRLVASGVQASDAPESAGLVDLVRDDEIAAAPPAGDPVEVSADEAAAILYTSGTTADPKGVVLTHGNLDGERAGVLAVVPADERDVVLGVLPLFHALAQMANLLLPLTIGARVVFLEQVGSATLLEALQARGITILACVPQFYYLIYQRVLSTFDAHGVVARRLLRLLIRLNTTARDRLGWNLGPVLFARVHEALGPSMRLLITGGSRFDPAVARGLYGLGVTVYNGYGLTETSGAATIVRVGDRFTTSVGPPLPGVEVRIGAHGDAGDGEVMIRGPIVMREYWQRPDATAEVLQDGWLLTGDLGTIDEAGRVSITGRKKDVIVLSSGKNIYPEEIEAHYRQSKFVRELCVLGRSRPGEPASERLHAVVVPDEPAMHERGVVNVRELIRFELEGLSAALPAHKRILSYDVVLQPLPRTSTGKLRRNEIERQLREHAAAASTERAATGEEHAWLTDETRRTLAGAVASTLGRHDVLPEANLELDLGLDSMERVELLTSLETRVGRRVSPEIRAQIFTVRQLVEAVLAGGESAPPAAASDATGAARPWDAVLREAPDPAVVAELRRPKAIRALAIAGLLRVALAVARLVVRLDVRGQSNLPRRGAYILCPNHQSYLDGFFIAAIVPFRSFRQIFFVGATEYFETPLAAWGARAINIVPVDPDAQLVNAMRAAAAGLALGKVLMLFPEGERSIDGALKPFRKGAAILAAHLDVPIVPVAVDGFFDLWPRGRRFQWRALLRRPRISVRFGEPMAVRPGEHAAGTEELQQRVAALRPDVRRPPAPSGRE